MTFSERRLQEARQIIDAIDVVTIERMVAILVQVRDAGGRLFFLGVGGSAGNCGHAVNDCRKPKPGMILRAREKFGVDLAHSFMVGDRWRDIEAGQEAGCRTILIGDGYGESFSSAPTIKLASLSGVASWIIQQSRLDR